MHLCGAMDEHLRTIETGLQVRISHRQEHFRVEGPKAKAEKALDVLQALYELAGRTISKEKVQLVLASDTAMEEAEDGALVLHTRRTDLKARTPNQSVYLDNIAGHDITFGIGPAGTGKTYLAVACAVDALERSAVRSAAAATTSASISSRSAPTISRSVSGPPARARRTWRSPRRSRRCKPVS